MTDLAILYEHPAWFLPLFAALERRGIDFIALTPDLAWDPAGGAPARVVFNRIAMSSFLRDDEHPIFFTKAALDHWGRQGARVINGAGVMAVDASKARQLALIASLGLAIPNTRVVHRAADVPEAAETIGFPLVVKANIADPERASRGSTAWTNYVQPRPTARCRPASIACCWCRTMSLRAMG